MQKGFRPWLCRVFKWHRYVVVSKKIADEDGLVDIIQILCLSCGEVRTHVVGSPRRAQLVDWIQKENERLRQMLDEVEEQLKAAEQVRESVKENLVSAEIELAASEQKLKEAREMGRTEGDSSRNKS